MLSWARESHILMRRPRPFEGVLFALTSLLGEFAAATGEPAAFSNARENRPPRRGSRGARGSFGLGIYFGARHRKAPSSPPTRSARRPMVGRWRSPWATPPAIQERHIELQRYYDYEVSEHQKVDGPVDLLEYLTFRFAGILAMAVLLGPCPSPC